MNKQSVQSNTEHTAFSLGPLRKLRNALPPWPEPWQHRTDSCSVPTMKKCYNFPVLRAKHTGSSSSQHGLKCVMTETSSLHPFSIPSTKSHSQKYSVYPDLDGSDIFNNFSCSQHLCKPQHNRIIWRHTIHLFRPLQKFSCGVQQWEQLSAETLNILLLPP